MVDKNCILQIFGTLMKNPSLLSNTEKYSLSTLDFSPGFEKYIFNAIQGLYEGGAKVIRPIDIEGYAQTNAAFKGIFKTQHGLEYLQDAEELSQLDSFDYYYSKLKKMNLLRDLNKNGIDTSDFYIEDLGNAKALEINSKFEDLTIKDIVSSIKGKLLKVEGNYLKDDVTETEKASVGIKELLDEIVENPDIGCPIQGEIFNEVINGARKGTLCIRSGGSGVSKTRQAVGDACYLAYPFRFNPETHEWEKNGGSEKVLFIATEQNFKEIRRMILAYLTGMNESKFRYGRFTELEKKVIEQARYLMELFEDNFYIVRMPNPTIELVKMIIRENVLLKGVQYVFYDYIFIGPSLLNEFKGFNLRNDEVLLMFATALKDVAVELDVFVMTSTQVNANSDDNKNIRGESSLAGGRSTINKADVGAIMARVTKEELELIKEFSDKYGEPNIVTDIYKVRSGEYNQVRIWSKVDLGNLRKVDLFVTDSRLQALKDFNYMTHFFYEENGETSIELSEKYEKITKLTDF